MRKAVSHAWLTYQHAKYGVLARTLPKLLRDAQAADAAYAGGDEARDAAHLLGQVYQIASSALRKLGEHELAWLAADRSIAVSQRAGDQLLAGIATTRVGNALLALGRARPALEVNVNIANRLAPGGGNDATPERLSVYGMLLLQGAMAAARIGDTRHRARPAQRRRGGGRRSSAATTTTTGPASARPTCELHRAAAAVELGEGGRAVETHDAHRPGRLRRAAARAAGPPLLDIARGLAQIGDVAKAGEMLLRGRPARPVGDPLPADRPRGDLRRAAAHPGRAAAADRGAGRADGSRRMSAGAAGDRRREHGRRGVLYVIACGSPARPRRRPCWSTSPSGDGWDVCVVTTPGRAQVRRRAGAGRADRPPGAQPLQEPGRPGRAAAGRRHDRGAGDGQHHQQVGGRDRRHAGPGPARRGPGQGPADRRDAVHQRGDGRAPGVPREPSARLRELGRHGPLRRRRRAAAPARAPASDATVDALPVARWRCEALPAARSPATASRRCGPGAPPGGLAPVSLAGREHDRVRADRRRRGGRAGAALPAGLGRGVGPGRAGARRAGRRRCAGCCCVVDCVPETVDEALAAGADLIVAHHPLLLRGVSSVAPDHLQGPVVHRLIRAGVALYVAHTNADVANPGVSDALAARLGLPDLRPLVRRAGARRRRRPRSAGSASCPRR